MSCDGKMAICKLRCILSYEAAADKSRVSWSLVGEYDA
jgi:hypothetical protein